MTWLIDRNEFFIGGEWVPADDCNRLQVISPFTEKLLATVPEATPAHVDAAVSAARHAFDEGPWPRTDLSTRIEVVQRLAEKLEENREALAQLVTAEMGSPISLSRWMHVGAPISKLRAYVELAATYPFQELRRAPSGDALVLREPVGVVAAISPWNAPLSNALSKIVPALLTGCTVVLKSDPQTPLTVYALMDLLEASGLPPGVVSMLPAEREVSEYLVSHSGVDKVSLTGSMMTGRRVAAVCGDDLKRLTLELGGKSAAIILDDADLESTVASFKTTALRNSGQICSNRTRLLVSENRVQELTERVVALLDSMPIGDPSDSDTEVGPLVSARQRSHVEEYISIGKAEGATVVRGGTRPQGVDHGWFIEPTVFSQVEPGMRIAQEEIFGPVLSIMTYKDENEAVAIANDSVYGLSGAVHSSDAAHALTLARRMRTGVVELNGSSIGFSAPFGGYKLSGLGRDSGYEGLSAFVELKSVGLPGDLADTLERASADG